MTTEKHTPGWTPEPWRYQQETIREIGRPDFIRYAIYRDSGDYGFVCECHKEADAARIVACVNALSGIPDPAAFVREAKEAKASNKELREELKLLTEKYHRAAGEAMYHRDNETYRRNRDREQERETEI